MTATAANWVKIHSHPRRARRRTERIELRWIIAFYVALWRGNRTMRREQAKRAAMERLRMQLWSPPA